MADRTQGVTDAFRARLSRRQTSMGGKNLPLETAFSGRPSCRQELMYGVSASDPDAREDNRKLLLQYCRLDTAAMVMIWKHWMR